MAKVKNKKKKTVNKKSVKSSRDDAIRSNPFEVRVNRKKHDILGRKTERNERGLPGVSRSRAIEKRKQTLLKEYKNRHKTKNLQDRRFGEKDETLTQEEKNIQRQIKLAEITHRKKNIYNLEEEDLTHYGQSIGDIEVFDELQLSSDEDHNVDDTETHFGGFLKKKSELLSSDETTIAPSKTRKQAIEELVVKSKQHKFERQKEKEKVEELLEAIDGQWSNVQMLMYRRKAKDKSNFINKSNEYDDFDQVVKDLESEPRAAVAGDRMKTQEEKSQIETERLKNLEEERDRRMAWNISTEEGTGMGTGMECISGDQDIGSSKNSKKSDKRVMIRYDDGNVVLPVGITSLTRSKEPTTSSDTEGSEEEDGDSTNDDGDSEDIMDSDMEEGGEEDYSDGVGGNYGDDILSGRGNEGEYDDDDNDGDGSQAIGEATDVDIKDVIDIASLLSECTPSQCGSTLTDLVTKLSSSNTTKELKSLFSSTLEYCLNLADSLDTVAMETIHNLAKPLFQMCQTSPAHCVKCIQGHLKQSFKRYQKSLKKDTIQYPIKKDIILFKVVEILFPMSDFHHPVTTPTLQLMTLGISVNDSVSGINEIIRSSFVCQLLIKCISLSKRYIPELLNYLTEVLHLYDNDEGTCISSPFSSEIRTLGFQQSLNSDHKPLSLWHLMTNTDTDTVRMLSLFHVSVKQVHQLSYLWDSVPLYSIILLPTLTILKNIHVNIDNSEIKAHLTSTIANIEHNSATRSLPILQLLRQKPKSIRFFEPSIDMDYQPGKKKYPHKSAGEKMKLKYKHKRELKGAIREIRKDSKFLAKERIKEQVEKDAVRKKKVQQIDGWLQQERGEARTEKYGRKRRK